MSSIFYLILFSAFPHPIGIAYAPLSETWMYQGQLLKQANQPEPPPLPSTLAQCKPEPIHSHGRAISICFDIQAGTWSIVCENCKNANIENHNEGVRTLNFSFLMLSHIPISNSSFKKFFEKSSKNQHDHISPIIIEFCSHSSSGLIKCGTNSDLSKFVRISLKKNSNSSIFSQIPFWPCDLS